MARDQRTNDQERLINGAPTDHGEAAQGGFPRLPSYGEISNTYPAQSANLESQGFYDATGNYNSAQDSGPQSSRFGLIRGYHRQMYEPVQTSRQCCDCSALQNPSRDKQSPEYNWGIICGCVLLILGVLALVMGFLLPQKSNKTREAPTPEENKDLEQIDLFVDIFIISGLSILSVGGLAISAGLLLPLFRRTREPLDETFKFYGSEVYVKQDEPVTKSGNPMGTVNFGFHRDVVPTDISLRKIQPEMERTEPIDLDPNLLTKR